MRYAQLTTIVAFAAALTVTACNRTQPAEETVRDEAAEARQKMQNEAAELDKKVADLDREWNEMQAKMATRRTRPRPPCRPRSRKT